jgi:PKD repeat protein
MRRYNGMRKCNKKLTKLLLVFAVIISISAIGSASAADTPSANFTSNSTSDNAPLVVQFNDTSTGDPSSWIWNFGDNQTSTEQNPIHTYYSEGSYNVSLTAINAIGNTTVTKNNYIAVAIPPNVNTSLSGGTYSAAQTVTLTSDDPTATIYYANDTTDPRTSDTRTKYTGPITISSSTTLRYAAVDAYGNWSLLYIQNYLIGSGGLFDSASPTYQINNNHTGQSPYTGPQNNTIKWNVTNITSFNQDTSVVIGSDGTIYCVSTDGYLYAIDPNGILQWICYGCTSTPTIGKDGTIYAVINGYLQALKTDGTSKWKYALTGAASPIVGADGTIYVASYDNSGVLGSALYAFNPDGTLKWNRTIPDATSLGGCMAIASDGTIYFPSADFLYAINLDGTIKWTYPFDGNHHISSPSIGPDGTIYISNQNRGLYALNPDGTLKWIYTPEGIIFGTVAIGSDGTLYTVSNKGILYALNPDKSVKWIYTTGQQCYSSPVIGADGLIYLSTYGGLFAINPNGTVNWTDSNIISSCNPVIGADGSMYLLVNGGWNKGLYTYGVIVANFNSAVNSNPLKVQFTDTSDHNPVSWNWSFGDGTTSTEQNPLHSYAKSGTYTVILTITTAQGDTFTISKKITVNDINAPTADVSLTGGIFSTPPTVSLTATDDSENAIIYYTTDNTDPRTSSTRMVYSQPLLINETTTLRYAAVDLSGNWSPAYAETYAIKSNTTSDVFVQNASYYSGSLNDQIQAILDNTAPGSTVEFLGQLYENLHLVINKPLSIISKVGTKITSSNPSGTAVFTINGTLASGTTINGFIIENTGEGSGILVNNTRNATISNVQATSTSGSAIDINESSNTKIKNSFVTGSSTGINVSNSTNTQINSSDITNNNNGINIENSTNISFNQNQIVSNVKNGVSVVNSDNITADSNSITQNGNSSKSGSGIYLENTTNIHINNNQINDNYYGITANNIINALIERNSFINNAMDGILFSLNVTNTTIFNNTIQKNDNGINVNCANENLNIIGNLITDNTKKASGKKDFHGNGILLGSSYEYSPTILVNQNVILNNLNMDFQSCQAQTYYIAGSNWVGSYCKKVTYDPPITMEILRTGDSQVSVIFRDGKTNDIATDLPSIEVTIIIQDQTWTGKTTNGIFTVTYNFMASGGDMIGKSYNMVVSTAYNSLISSILGYSNNDNSNSESSSNTNYGNNPGTGSSGGSSGSGASSGSASAVGATAAASAAGSSGSSGQGQSSQTVQELITDEITKNPNVWAIIGVILLLVLVLGAYYRKDLMNMIRKSKK